ncbi:MAG: LPP20 family lipoprotein, partial [Spirochaetes bacterium]|nr:LPP20 family lipoprotein [Spirochaetota bacterium]
KKGDKYIVYALIRLDLDEMTKAVDNSLKNFSNEYNELNAGKGLEDLADEIKGKITKAFKKTSIAKKEKEIKKEIEKLEEKAQQGDVIETGKKPDWIEDYPISSEYYIGIGQGKAMQQAKDGGINTLVTQIEVNVKSEINDFIKETDGVTEEEISQNIKLTVKENIEDLELVGLWKDTKGDEGYWAYYRLNIEAYKRRQLEKMENAKRNGLDFLKKCDAEVDPALKFKYAFLGYYLVGKYVTRALKVDYNGKEVILVNELTERMQKIMSGFSINTSFPKIEIDKINPKAMDIKFNIKHSQKPVINFPVKFMNNKGELEISKKAITDSNGNVNCIVSKAISSEAMQSFLLQLDISSFIEDTAESEEDIVIFYNRISKLGIPSKEIIVKVNPPVFTYDLAIEEDLNFEPKYQKIVKSMCSNFKNLFSKKT